MRQWTDRKRNIVDTDLMKLQSATENKYFHQQFWLHGAKTIFQPKTVFDWYSTSSTIPIMEWNKTNL